MGFLLDRVTFVVENGSVRIINSAIYAMERLQKQMEGEAMKAGLNSEESVVDLVREVRADGEE